MIEECYTQFRTLCSIGTQLQLSSCAQAGKLAHVIWGTTTSHRPDFRVVKLRPEWQHLPTFQKSGEIAWEWGHIEPSFYLLSGDRVMVLAMCTVTTPAPPNYGPEDWEHHVALVQKFDEPGFGWCNASNLEIPWLM